MQETTHTADLAVDAINQAHVEVSQAEWAVADCALKLAEHRSLKRAFAYTGRSYRDLLGMARVARSWPNESRRDDIPFEVYRELAPLDNREAALALLLERAAAENLQVTVELARKIKRAVREERPSPSRSARSEKSTH